jgi:hypothetical protein
MIDNTVSGSPLPPIVQNLHSILLEQWQETWNILVAQFFAAPPQMMPAPAATRSEEAKSGQNTVEELGDLQDDWDGYGAASISREVRDNALHFIKVIEAAPFGMQAPEISPTPTGTISFEWVTPHTKAFLEIGNTRYSGFVQTHQQEPAYLLGRTESIDQSVVAFIHNALSVSPKYSASVTEMRTGIYPHGLVAA